MTIFKEDETTGISCGVNDLGDLFLGDSKSGYNMKDTTENRAYILSDFDNWTAMRRAHLRATCRGGVNYERI